MIHVSTLRSKMQSLLVLQQVEHINNCRCDLED